MKSLSPAVRREIIFLGAPIALAVLAVFARFAFVLVLGGLSGCATDTGNARKDRAGRVTNASLEIAGQALVTALFQSFAVGDEAEKINFAHSGAAGLWKDAGKAAVSSAFTSDNVRKLVDAYTGGKLPAVAVTAATQYEILAPATAAERVAVVNAFADTISRTALDSSMP